jgi:hypothetical protein
MIGHETVVEGGSRPVINEAQPQSTILLDRGL